MIEYLLVLYFTLGQFKISINNHYDVFILFVCEIIFLLKNFRLIRIVCLDKVLIIYALLMFICLSFIGVLAYRESFDILDRYFKLFSLSLFILFFLSKKPLLSFTRVIFYVLKTYFFISVIILIDIFSFFIFNKSIWPAGIWGLRFYGPFYDPNFMGLTYGVMFLISLKESKYVYSISFILMVLFSVSWTACLLLIMSIVLSRIVIYKSIFIKKLCYVIISIVFPVVVYSNIDKVKNVFVDIFINYLPRVFIEMKFESFNIRITTQYNAIMGILKNPFGYGIDSVVPNLGHDPHSSYLDFVYENGVFGYLFLLIFFLLIKNDKKDLFISRATTFIFSFALLLGVHYQPVYFFVVFILLYYNFYSKLSGGFKLIL